jgi:thioredoxin-like negative regulator of GroEL
LRGDIDDAVSPSCGDYFARAELERLHGRLLLVTDNRSECQSALEHALALARRQGAALFELRAAINLAELFVDNRDSKRARGILAPIVESYREQREGADYRRALALLNKIETSEP